MCERRGGEEGVLSSYLQFVHLSLNQSNDTHLNPDCLQLTASFVFILPPPPLHAAFHTRPLLLHHSIFSGSILSRSISGEATQHMHSFWVFREILSSIYLRKAGLELGGRWMQMK